MIRTHTGNYIFGLTDGMATPCLYAPSRTAAKMTCSMQIFRLNLHKNHKFSGIAIDLIAPIELGTA